MEQDYEPRFTTCPECKGRKYKRVETHDTDPPDAWIEDCPTCKGMGIKPDMTREEAAEIVRKAAGRRPDFPSGKDFLDEVRHNNTSKTIGSRLLTDEEIIKTNSRYEWETETDFEIVDEQAELERWRFIAQAQLTICDAERQARVKEIGEHILEIINRKEFLDLDSIRELKLFGQALQSLKE